MAIIMNNNNMSDSERFWCVGRAWRVPFNHILI